MLRAIKQVLTRTSNWSAIRDQEVRRAELEAAIDLKRLEEEHRVLEAQRARVEAELARMDESEAGVLAHEVRARTWAGLVVLTLGIAALSGWWSVSWFLTLGWEKWLIAATLIVLPLVGWIVFLTAVAEEAQRWDLRRVFAGLGLVIILCSATAIAALGSGRMLGVSLQEEGRHAELAEQGAGGPADGGDARRERIERVKRLLNALSAIAIVLMGLAGEVAAGLAFHEYWRHRVVVRTVKPFYATRNTLDEALVANAVAQEEARQRPALVHAELTVEGLQAEVEVHRQSEREERQRLSLAPVLRWVAIGFVTFLLILLAVVWAAAEPPRHVTVILLDLSTSAQNDFAANGRAVESVIRSLPPGSRLAVFGVTEASFGREPILAVVAPREPGRFGEYLGAWQARTVRTWRTLARGLTPRARGSDLLGAVARAQVEFQETPEAERRLVIVSDMRHVGRGFNFERRPTVGPVRVVDQIERARLIPTLEGVEVWMLGVHTAGVDESHWNQLRAIWTEYLRRAGASLKAFSPNRRWGGQ